MPEYLAPGVYVEEVSFRAKSIEGVSTSTAGFAGPTRYGPLTGEPLLLTSFNQFERIYGGLDQLAYPPKPIWPGRPQPCTTTWPMRCAPSSTTAGAASM